MLGSSYENKLEELEFQAFVFICERKAVHVLYAYYIQQKGPEDRPLTPPVDSVYICHISSRICCHGNQDGCESVPSFVQEIQHIRTIVLKLLDLPLPMKVALGIALQTVQ